ncbi:putative GTP-binding protein OBGM, mitochondrial [Iris pallida]|uniref:GTP-binding protein OBGM, mitochondrial n=1 Tax=Iris pallida TaxID=29817 RepID=A0AAX6H877_IRIPA|nr:putative GTP-binding protein OBGM, mitochondrial [Iris pallida]
MRDRVRIWPREARVGMEAGAIGVSGTTATGSQTRCSLILGFLG